MVLVTTGGIRRQESFSTGGIQHIPKLYGELLPQSLFYPYVVNEGVTSHFNTIASILTGNWQHVDDWGSQKPMEPTLFHYLQTAATHRTESDLGGDEQQAVDGEYFSGSERHPLEAIDG